MANTFKLIGHKVIDADTTSITFSGISQDFNDLILMYSDRSTRTDYDASFTAFTVNGSATGYSYTFGGSDNVNTSGVYEQVTDGSATAGRLGGTNTLATGFQANSFSSNTAYFPSYTSTTKSKAVLTYGGGNFLGTTKRNLLGVTASRWATSNAPITSITLSMETGNISAGSTYSLYGIGA
jgi:hypothetical protein